MQFKSAIKKNSFYIPVLLIGYLIINCSLLFAAGDSDDATAKAAAEASKFVENLNNAVLFPTIGLLSVIALAVFIWGCLEYVMNASNEQSRQKGVKHITYGIIGLLIMSSAWLILSLAANTFGLKEDLTCADDPSAQGCDTYFKAP